MRKNIHPKYKKVQVQIGDDTFETSSTYAQDVIYMDIDYRKHPAWTGKGVTSANEANSSVKSFARKFGGINFGAFK